MKKWLLGLLASFSVLVSSAQAAVDPAVTTALTTAATDVATIGGAVLVVIIGAAVFKYMRRAT